MKNSVFMEEMDAFTYREKLAKDAVVFIPVGALEQHGSHMAMCVDAALTKAMAGATAEALTADTDGALEGIVCSAINFGYRSQQRSGGGFHLSGTTSLSGTTIISLARDICYSLIEDGARKIVFMNGHYENYQFIFEGAELALEKASAEGIKNVKIQLLSYWDFVDDATIQELYPDGFTGWDLEHAGVMETSLMLLFYPDLVDMDRIDPALAHGVARRASQLRCCPLWPTTRPPSGCLSHPGASTRAKRASSCVTLPWPIWSSPSRMNSAEQVISMRTNDAAAEVAPVAHEPHSDLKRVAASSFLGNFIEWFDYATYTYFAITIGQVFFPGSEVNSTLMAFAIFALAFIFRPLGAMFWGSMGDKKGRKQSLAISVLLMSGAAFLIGCLPSYQAIGLASPILLLVLRSVQGFSVAGEYSGAAVFLAEYAPPEKRGRYCSLVPASTATGLLAGSTMALVLKMVLPEAAIIEWGWRIPFLLAGPLGFIAHYIRTKLEDSPAFVKMEEGNKEAEHPTHLVFKKYRKRLLSSVAATMVNAVGFYLVLTYLPTYLTSYTSMEASQAQLATDIALIAYLLIIFGSGTLSDKVGRRRMLLTACVAFIVLSIPCFLMLGTASLPIVIVAELIMCVTLSLNDANIACYQAEMFPTEVRYTGAALGSNIAYVVFGGTASFVATALIDATGNGLMPAFYMMAISAVAGVILFFTAHDYNGIPLDEIR